MWLSEFCKDLVQQGVAGKGVLALAVLECTCPAWDISGARCGLSDWVTLHAKNPCAVWCLSQPRHAWLHAPPSCQSQGSA